MFCEEFFGEFVTKFGKEFGASPNLVIKLQLIQLCPYKGK